MIGISFMRKKSRRLVILEIFFNFSEHQSEETQNRNTAVENGQLSQLIHRGELMLWVAVRSSVLTSPLQRKINFKGKKALNLCTFLNISSTLLLGINPIN